MNEMQMSLWEHLYATYKITKPIRLIECFAGIGSQYKALKNLNINVESYKIVEWAYNSIIAYNNIHIKDFTNYAEDKTKEELVKSVQGISVNYSEPLTNEQLQRKSLNWLQTAYNNIKATHNLVNIMQVKGSDLEIVDKDKYEYIMTYSFPCQDLSLAGLQKGMDLSQAEGGTRSGLLWEIKRILEELKETNSLPQILLMENVPMLISKLNIHNFKKWDTFLNDLGYKNYTQCLNAKDYGIPQNRNRCFMVSVLGDYNYTFPRKQKLKLKLKDMLEENVDEKYFLSNKMIEYITANNEKWTGNNEKSLVNKNIASTINTGEGSKRCDASNYICEELPDNCDIKEMLKANPDRQPKILIKNATNENNECGGSGNIPKVITKDNTLLKTKLCNDLIENDVVEEGDIINHSYTNGGDGKNPNYRQKLEDYVETKSGVMPTITTRVDTLAVVVKDKRGNEFHLHKDTKQLRETIEKNKFEKGKPLNIDLYNRSTYKHSQTLTDGKHNSQRLFYGLRIRKLTPKECCRLMGFEDKDYNAMKQDLSDMAIYHCCGDSIVVNVLENIFKQLI